MGLHAVTIFLSAFLLFQVQPVIARIILAWFGGSAAVWTTCMLFFQVGLLGGYFYSHYAVRRLRPRRQAIVHTILLGLSLLYLPILPGAQWKPAGSGNPTLQIILLLGATVGLPYLALATTGPLVQAWHARSDPGGTPYRLFALSNLGSLLALLSYPPLVEPYLPTTVQAWSWSCAYAGFAVLCASAAWRSVRFPALAEAAGEAGEESPPRLSAKLFWVALAACPSMLMLAVTNHLTQDVAAIPFLWVLPLTLYLLSFILTFDARGWYQRNLFLVLLAPALGGMAYLQWSNSGDLRIQWSIASFAAALFVACMVCHGELAARKPSPRHLTSFYLMLSVGGAMGGLFVGLAAPYLFPNYFELPIALGLCGLLALLVAVEEPGLPFYEAMQTLPAVSLLAGMLGLWVFLGKTVADSVKGYRLVQRNFYGTLRVRQEGKPEDWESYRTLLHGSINHGEQWLHASRHRELLTYYCSGSGIGRAMRTRREGVPHKVGVLGLGAGTMAAFGRPGDEYRFYEINPQVPVLAHAEFTFLSDSRAGKTVVMGDGRLSLEREPDQNFDVLMMDAFSGDSIPVHLMTKEAFQLYLRHLKEDGLLVIHISNKYLDLEPVLAQVQRELGLAARKIESEESEDGNCFGTTYVLFAKKPEVFTHPVFSGAGFPPKPKPRVNVWTDDYSNLFRILK